VYRALDCAKIYTVFLPMPGKNWTMQYCPKRDPAEKPVAQSSTVIHMEPPLVPPQAETDSTYDFKRLPVPIEKASKLIVLRGVMLADGSIADLEVYQSILPQMDEAARLAFSRWKFKAPLRDGKPISAQILVGIPAQLPNETDK
jgi:hypothetical protein